MNALFSDCLRVLWPWQLLSVLGHALSTAYLAQVMPSQGHPPSCQRPRKKPRAVNGAKSRGHTPLLLLLSSIPSGAAAETGKQRHMSKSCKLCGWKRTSREDRERREPRTDRSLGAGRAQQEANGLPGGCPASRESGVLHRVFCKSRALPTPCSLCFPRKRSQDNHGTLGKPAHSHWPQLLP